MQEIQQHKIDESSFEMPEETIEQPYEEMIETDNETCRINEFGEVIRENNTVESVIQDSDIGIDTTQNTLASKRLEQPQQIQETQTTNMWKNRFQNWYSAIDRVSQNSKGKFLTMKADIVRAISNRIKVRDKNKIIGNQEKDI